MARGGNLRHRQPRGSGVDDYAAWQPPSVEDARARAIVPAAGARILWMFWDSPTLPAIVRLCRRSLERHAGRGWSTHAVSRASARQLVGSGDLPRQFDTLQPSFQADALRLALLRRYGGAWVDATAIANKDLEDWAGTAFDDGRSFVGFYIGRYTAPEGPPLVASWALAVPQPEQRLMVAWHEAYLQLWRGNRTSEEGITDDPFFDGADLHHVDPLMQDYLHVELVLLALLQRDSSLRQAFDGAAELQRAEDTAYALQATMGLGWMVNHRCAPVSTPFAALPQETQSALMSTPFVKLRHEDRKWLMEMPVSMLLRHPDSVLGSVLARNTGLNATAAPGAADLGADEGGDACEDAESDVESG